MQSHAVIKEWDKKIIKKLLQSVTKGYHKVRQVLQSVTQVCYKMYLVLQSDSVITKCDKLL